MVFVVFVTKNKQTCNLGDSSKINNYSIKHNPP